MRKKSLLFLFLAFLLCSCLYNSHDLNVSFRLGPGRDDGVLARASSSIITRQIPEPDRAPTPQPGITAERIRLGSERLFEQPYFSLIEGRRIAIMANQTALATVDRLIEEKRTTLAAIFAPEHGLLGVAAAGYVIEDGLYRDVPVYACYGNGDPSRRIRPDLLADIDVLLFEIQDLGTRHYTFISSMYLAMDSAADASVTFVVLDRPVAVGGALVEGPVLENEYQTFVGIGKIPNRYAMTIGELALMFKAEADVMDGPRYPRKTATDPYYNVRELDLVVVPMTGYNRLLCYDEQNGIGPWVPPSPNIPSVNAALCYVGSGLYDGNTIAEMVGGLEQFSHISFPFVKTGAMLQTFIANAYKIYDFPGVTLEPIVNPRTGIMNVVQLRIIDRLRFNSTRTALVLLYTQMQEYSDETFFTSGAGMDMFRKIHGNAWFVLAPGNKAGLPRFSELADRITEEETRFRRIREKYLLYDQAGDKAVVSRQSAVSP